MQLRVACAAALLVACGGTHDDKHASPNIDSDLATLAALGSGYADVPEDHALYVEAAKVAHLDYEHQVSLIAASVLHRSAGSSKHPELVAQYEQQELARAADLQAQHDAMVAASGYALVQQGRAVHVIDAVLARNIADAATQMIAARASDDPPSDDVVTSFLDGMQSLAADSGTEGHQIAIGQLVADLAGGAP